jgi:Uncharacterized phage-associated protein
MYRSAQPFAYWFIKNNYDTPRNTFDGNMKLQKLLYFSQLVHLAKYDEPLFDDTIYAFRHGSVVETVRQPYHHDFQNYVIRALSQKIDLTSEQLDTLQTVEEIFGQLSASELSDINHEHVSWRESYGRSLSGGYSWKENAYITIDQLRKNEVDLIKETIKAYEDGLMNDNFIEINNVKFYYDPNEIELDSNLLTILESFSGEDSSYTIYKDETAGLVIF